MKKTIQWVILGTALLGACAHRQPSASGPLGGPAQPVSVAIVANRYLTTEPCGCSFGPQGGLEREKNWRKVSGPSSAALHLHLESGTTFVPKHEDFAEARLPAYRDRARSLAHALAGIGFDAFSPSLDDLSLGLETIRSLEGVAFVSSNLAERGNGHLIFAPYRQFFAGDTSVIVTGLTAERSDYPLPEGVVALSPLPALAALLESLPRGEHFLIVLSNLPRSQREELQSAYPQVGLVLGGAPDDTSNLIQQPSARQLYLNPTGMGRAIGHLEFQFLAPGAPFHNPEAVRYLKEERARLLGRVDEVACRRGRADFGQVPDLKSDCALLDQIHEIVDSPAAGRTAFDGGTDFLTDRFSSARALIAR